MANTDAILAKLIEQRDQVEAAIRALSGGSVTRRGRPPGKAARTTGTRKFSAAAKKRLSAAAKARWAKAKKEGKNSL
jgi:hypothetical protein